MTIEGLTCVVSIVVSVRVKLTVFTTTVVPVWCRELPVIPGPFEKEEIERADPIINAPKVIEATITTRTTVMILKETKARNYCGIQLRIIVC